LMQQLPSGTMLSIQLPEQEVQLLLRENLFLAGSNSPTSSVVSGSAEAIAQLQQTLQEKSIPCRRLHTSHAFHSPMMEPMMEPFTELLRQITFNPPQIPFVSNLTGTWVTPTEATDPNYWARHLREPVRFSAGLTELLKKRERVLLEVGPGRTLSTLAKQHQVNNVVLTSLRHPQEQRSDVAFLLSSLGRLWLKGTKVDWSSFYAHERRYHIPLPTYPFERQRYWIEPTKPGEDNRATTVSLGKKPDIADWFYIPFWKPSVPPLPSKPGELISQKSCTVVFIDEYGLGTQLLEGLQTHNQDVITVKVGDKFAQLNESLYILNPQQSNDYHRLLNKLLAQQKFPETIVHLWNITPVTETQLRLARVEKAQETGFYSLLFLAQALGKQHPSEQLQIIVVSNNMQSVTGEEVLSPEKVTLLGPVKVIPQEYSNITCRSIDIVLPSLGSWQQEKLTEQLLTELRIPTSEQLIAYRGNHRWVQTFEPVRLDKSVEETPRLREAGVYLITGGLGGIGLVLAKHLAKTVSAKLILTGRSALPARQEWDSWLATHDETDNISRKILKVQELEELGAEVLVISADVANLEQMTDAIAQAQQQFGALHGVIHAAGVLGEKSFGAIAWTNKIECEQQFQSKIYGLLVLEKVLQNQELDFCLLMSSLSSILGGLGFAAYGAANLFMDALIYQHNQTNSIPWLSVNWDAWQVELEQKESAFNRTSLAEFVLTPEEGIKAFQRILSRGDFYHQIVISTGDLQWRLRQWINPKFTGERTADKKTSLHPRPDLHNTYVPPRNETEQQLVDIWQQVLGIEQVGIHDNLFELGGDSLRAIQVISQLRKKLHIELSVNSMFEKPTVAESAQYIENTRYTIQQLQAPINAELGEITEIEL